MIRYFPQQRPHFLEHRRAAHAIDETLEMRHWHRAARLKCRCGRLSGFGLDHDHTHCRLETSDDGSYAANQAATAEGHHYRIAAWQILEDFGANRRITGEHGLFGYRMNEYALLTREAAAGKHVPPLVKW